MEASTNMKNTNLKKKKYLVNLPRNKSYEQNLSNIIFNPNKRDDTDIFIRTLETRYQNLSLK
uniref:Uncharacterized protein n=1 Tax=Megaviridae environmental sample TaxID=1737588 RepID=A0A5J6VLF7_9VIRU|nr:MAG: hypothetical protein [Megaviridae environmental sample]